MLTKCYHCGSEFDRDTCPDCRAGLGPDPRIVSHVYEAVDHTDDEVYHTLGLWATLDAACRAIRPFEDRPGDLCEYSHEDGDYFQVIIWSRRLNEFDTKRQEVARFEWSRDYDETADEFCWKMREVIG
jgi:hypothetical protein